MTRERQRRILTAAMAVWAVFLVVLVGAGLHWLGQSLGVFP